MTARPRSFARWQRQLSLFSDENATLLGRLVQRLAPAFDSLFRAQQEPSGEIDGFDGIGNRGSYERLLASEWMLRRGAPLEFLRRAASGEQSFFQLAYQRPAAPESTLVLLDSGPDQLGDCRLVQLAMLVLLIERAESNGHELRWQLLQRYGEPVCSGLNEALVRSFLNGRSGARSSARTLEAWQSEANGRRLWLIGAPALTALAGAAFARVALTERVASDVRVVDAVLQSAGQARQVELALPEPADAARLIRDPFTQVQAARQKTVSVSSQLRISQNGRFLMYRDARGDLLSTAIPNSPAAKPGGPRRYAAKAGAFIGCVGRSGRNLVWLSQQGSEISVGFANHTDRPKHALHAEGPPLAREQITMMAWYPQGTAVFEAADRSLWRVDFTTQRSRKIAEGVRAWLQLDDRRLVAVDRWLKEGTTPQPRLLMLSVYDETSWFEVPGWDDAHLATNNHKQGTLTLGFAEGRLWSLLSFTLDAKAPQPLGVSSRTTLHAPGVSTVLGCEPFRQPQNLPGLWLLESSLREVSIVGRRGARSVIHTATDIERVAVSTSAARLATLTQSGLLSVVDARGKLLYHTDVER